MINRADVLEDIEALDQHYGGNGRANAIQLAFFSGSKSPDGIDEVEPSALIATATVINYAPAGAAEYKQLLCFRNDSCPATSGR